LHGIKNENNQWSTEDCGLVSVVIHANVAGATLAKEAAVGLETQRTQVKLGRKSLRKIQTSTAFI